MKKALIVVALVGLFMPAFAEQSVTFTAQGQGYYVVTCNGVEVSQHTTEREALESATNATIAGQTCQITHDYRVDVTHDPGTTEPPPEDDTTGDTGTVDPEPSTLDQLAACDPDVIYSGGSLGDVLKSIPAGGTVGIEDDLELTKSEVYLFNGARVGRICGVPREDGTKPVLTAPRGSAWSFSDFGRVVIDNLRINGITAYVAGTFDELRVDRVDWGQTGGRCLFASYGPSAIGPITERPGKVGDDPVQIDSRITLTNTSMRDCTGPSNSTHSMYLSRRGCVLRADNVSIEAIDQLEAFRSLCRVNVVTNSHFTNVVRESDGSLRLAREGKLGPYGVTPLDTPSCGAYILRGNTFDVHSDGGTVAAIGLRARLSITSCDMPNNWHLENLTTKVPWTEVAPEVGNPHLFPVVVEDNTFRFHGTSDNERIISAWGTYPRRHTDPVTSSSNADYLAVPDQWRERTTVFWKNNTVEGGWSLLHRLDLQLNKAETSDPNSWALSDIPAVHFVETTEALPQTCDDLAYLDWWDEPGDHDGFPACP